MSSSRPNVSGVAVSPGARNRATRVSRVRACSECKRHKIRCEVKRGETSCNKCLRSGIECIPHDVTQILLDEDRAETRWKSNAAQQIGQLQAAVKCLLRQNRLPDLSAFKADEGAVSSPTSGQNITVVPMDMTRENSPERQQDDPGLVPAPMSSLYGLTKVRHLRSNAATGKHITSAENDLIAHGVISVDEAQYLFTRFLEQHHPLMWGGVMFPQQNLDAVRQASTLLTTAILTISALHTPDRSESLQKCYEVFVSLVSNSCLSRNHNLDDVRGLCLAAFYLPNLCWRLSGLAVRMAAEMNLHQSFNKLRSNPTEHHERVRLWYTLYVCDRHFSIAYGRPPAMFYDAAISGIETFLQSPLAIPGDTRVSAQVALFRILTDAHLEYGSDQDQPLTEEEVDKLRIYNLAVEQWRLVWESRSVDSPVCGKYPSKGVVLYSHFARFQLNSLALRGINWPAPNHNNTAEVSSSSSSLSTLDSLSPSRREAAKLGIAAAMSTLTVILEEADIRDALTGVPLFAHAQVAFCATFLLKMAAIFGRGDGHVTQGLGVGFDLGEVLWLTRRSADMLSDVAAKLSDKHLARHIVAGIREMLQRVVPVDYKVGAADVDALERGQKVNAGYEFGGGGGGDVVEAPQNGNWSAVPDMNGNAGLDNLVGLLEFGFDETFLGQFANDLWTAPM